MRRAATVRPAWFGKLASRGDFVRSARQGELIQRMDQWLSQGLELLAGDPRWKHLYDQAAPAHFAFLSARSRQALAGHLVPSLDASGRRFPFVTLGAFDVERPRAFMPHAPMALARLWPELGHHARRACQAEDAATLLAGPAAWPDAIEVAPEAYATGFRDFVGLQTLGTAEALLRAAHPHIDLRQLLLGLGMLLQPVPASGRSRLDRGVRLPLPGDPLQAPLVAALWLHLVCPFLARGDFELLLLLPGEPGAAPWMSIGFSGGAASTVRALFDPRQAERDFITLLAPDWVERQVAADHAMNKLSSYLRQPQLSMAQALSTFAECFLGE